MNTGSTVATFSHLLSVGPYDLAGKQDAGDGTPSIVDNLETRRGNVWPELGQLGSELSPAVYSLHDLRRISASLIFKMGELVFPLWGWEMH